MSAPSSSTPSPDYQNPTGLSLSSQRRVAVVELCRRLGILVVEDVAYRELGFTDRRDPSLWSLAPDVVQIGTFSKTFFPGVRLGWATGPVPVIRTMVDAKQNTDQCAGALVQRLVEECLRGGHMDRQLERSRSLYAHRCTTVLAALEDTMPAAATWTRPGGGFFTWLSAPGDVDTTAVSIRSAAAVSPTWRASCSTPTVPDGASCGSRLAASTSTPSAEGSSAWPPF